MIKLACTSHDINVEGGRAGHTNPFAESISVGLRDFLVLDQGSKSESELMFTIVLPHTSEVRFGCELGRQFVRESNIILLQDFRSEFAKIVPFSLEVFTSLSSGCVNAEDNWLFLVTVSE